MCEADGELVVVDCSCVVRLHTGGAFVVESGSRPADESEVCGGGC